MPETEESCSAWCGYVSSGRDLLEHEVYEHVRCTECGREPIGVHSVSHKPDCPRLQPGYVYPDAADITGNAAVSSTDQAAELELEADDWEPCDHDHDEDCYDYQGFFACRHQHCFACGGCNCPGYCDDYQTYNLRPEETGGAPADAC